MAEYIVTVTESANWQELHNELVNDGISVAKLRATNTRNTHYNLTTEQANNLKNDARVLAVQLESGHTWRTDAFQDTGFEKTNSNWGLLRHTNESNVYGTSAQDPNITYDYVLDGTGVDIVVLDTGIQPTHPEFQDANGVSRVKQIDWYTESGVSGTQQSGHYSDGGSHGTHVTGIVAGKTYGWAKNANIYSVKMEELDFTGTGISYTDCCDVIRGWHNAKAGSRPTILNISLKAVRKLYTPLSTGYLTDVTGSAPDYNWPCTGGTYRGGAGHINPIKWREEFGFRGGDQTGLMEVGGQIPSLDVDIKQCIDAGIIVCISAGNSRNKLVIPSDEDWDNSLIFTSQADGTIETINYMRPATPNLNSGTGSAPNPGFLVGSLDTTTYSSTHDRMSNFSNIGSAVNIYAAGSKIKSSIPTNSTASYNGTSMASPQIAGMCALLLQAHPEWTPKQVTNWFIDKSTDKMYSAGSTEFADNYSLLGGTPRVAYFPLNGRNVFTISGS